jgi:3-oxoacyl-[acyl-carrier protein] reductase
MAALFLASTGSAYITGQTLMVNGSGLGGARRSR